MFGVIVSLTKYKRFTFVMYIITAVVVTLSVALRAGDMGSDTNNYLVYFRRTGDVGIFYSYVVKKEPLYTLFNYLVHAFTNNQYVFLFLSAVIPYVMLFYMGKKQASNLMIFMFCVLSFSVGCSYYILSFSMMRQTLALGIWCLLLNRYIERGYKIDKVFIIGTVIMALIHNSSLMIIIPLLLDRVRLSKKLMVITCLLAYVAGLLASYLMPVITQVSALMQKDFYLTRNMDNFEWNPMQLLPYMGLFFVLLYYRTTEQCNNIFIKSYLLTIVICGLLGNMGTNLDRINMFFYVPSFLAVASLFTQLQRERRLIFIPILVVFMVYFTYKYFVIFDGVYESAPLVPWRTYIWSYI